MKKHGQIMSLDFLISVMAIVLAMGLLIQLTEVKTYSEKEEREWMELRQIAETAANLIVGNPELNCQVVDALSADLFKLPNCVDTSLITRGRLSVPTKYGFEVKEIESGIILIRDGNPGDKDYYETRVLIIENGGNITKANYLANNLTAEKQISIRVWLK